MCTEYDEKVKDYRLLSHGNYNEKMVENEKLEDDVFKLHTMPIHLGAFVLSKSTRKLKNFIPAIIEIFTN